MYSPKCPARSSCVTASAKGSNLKSKADMRGSVAVNSDGAESYNNAETILREEQTNDGKSRHSPEA
jgi:hypothetical protein